METVWLLVSRSRTPQTVKGFLTGGAVTTARYVARGRLKLAKRLVRKFTGLRLGR